MLRTLANWEEELRPQIAGGNILLGQLPLGRPPYNRADMDDLGRLLAVRFRRSHGFFDNLDHVERNYPLSLALFLVLQGIYNYEKGVYWSKPLQQLGIPEDGNHSSAIGRTFRQILNRFQLPTFRHIKGHANLVPILAHGGIPNYSLGDFFSLLHSSIKETLIQVDAETLVEEWGRNPEATFFWKDKPVQRFVLNGGAVAVDFVDQSITLITADNPASLAGLELPRRVITEYSRWREDRTVRPATGPRIRLQRPVLFIDPYGAGVAIELPSPFFPLEQGVDSLQWEVTAGDHSLEVTTDRQRVANGYEYEAIQEVQVPPAPSYIVTLVAGDTTIRTWTLDGIGASQILVFDPDSWRALGDDQYIHPGERWILYPRTGTLSVQGGQLTRQWPALYGEWRSYSLEEWIVTAGNIVSLEVAGIQHCALEISNQSSLRRPHLVGGTRPLSHHINPRFPLYSGEPPTLRIDFAQKPGQFQLGRWHISIRAEGSARPAAPISYQLSDLQPWLGYEDNGSVLLDLSAPVLLGSNAMGKFEIDARGPFGQSRRLGLRITPHLTVTGDERLYLDQTQAAADLRIICDRNSRVQLHSRLEGITFDFSPVAPTYYHVSATVNVHTLDFAIVSDDGVNVPFSIRLRRLRWALSESSDAYDLSWTSVPLEIHPDAFGDTYGAEVHIELPPFLEHEKLYGGWRLVDGSGNVWSQRMPDAEHSRRRFSIPFPELMAEYRKAREIGETLCLQAWVQYASREGVQTCFVDVVYLLAVLDLHDISSHWQSSENGHYLHLSWPRNQRVRNRILYLWPADEPWIERPQEIRIPDEPKPHYKFFIPHAFDVGSYRGDYLAVIEIKNGWSAQVPQRPECDQPNAFCICPPHAAAFYRALKQRCAAGRGTIDQMLTLLNYYHRTGAHDDLHTINRMIRAIAQRGELQVEHLVLWAELTQAVNRTAYKLVQRFTMFKIDIVSNLEQQNLSQQWRRRYFAHLPNDFNGQCDIYEILLAGDFPEVYELSLEALCRQGRRSGVEQLLSDVASGRHLVRDAVACLRPVMTKVVPYLIENGTPDALMLLRLLAQGSGRSPSWLQLGFSVKTNLGDGQIWALLNTESNESISCCWLDDPVIANICVSGQLAYSLDLCNRVAVISEVAYQCGECDWLSTGNNNIVTHHDKRHPYRSLRYRVLQPGSKVAFTDLAVYSGSLEKAGVV